MHDFRISDFNPTIIDFNLVADFHVIVEDHFLATTYDNGADFHRSQPVIMEMSDESTIEIDCEVGDVLDAIANVTGTICTHAGRRLRDKMIEDSDIMRCQIPEHIDVSLDETQV